MLNYSYCNWCPFYIKGKDEYDICSYDGTGIFTSEPCHVNWEAEAFVNNEIEKFDNLTDQEEDNESK